MTMRGFETVGVRAVIQGLPEYLAGARAITQANVGISGSLSGLSTITNGFKLLATAAAGVTAAIGGAAIASAVKYETTLAKIDALTNTSTEDTERLGKGLLNLSKVVPKSPNELGAAAYFALSSGITDVDDALKLVTAAAKASAAGLGSTADIVDIVTAAVNAYGPANLDAAHAVDVLVATVREGKGEPAQMAQALGSLLPLASALKIPFEDLAATFASLTNALGGSGAAEMAATQLRGILSQIASPSREAKNALAEAEAGVKHLSQEELELADAHRAVVSASDSLASSQRGIRDASEGVTQAQRGVRDALQGVADAQRNSRSATEALRNAYADLAAAQRNQQQASLDGRRETLSVLEAEQGLSELRAQAGSHAQEIASAELALAQARAEASAKGKKTALEQRQADLAVTQAQLRLNQVRAQGPRYVLDLQNAELRLSEARLRVGTAQRQQDKDLADRKKDVEKATQDVADASRAEIKAHEGVVDANRALNRSYESVDDAKRSAARAADELALAQEKELLAQIHTRDAYSDLRKEIAEKGLVPTLQRLNDLFKDNQEGLAKLFPDVRGFIGFLSAITSQGAATANILDRIKASTGITDEAFKRMSETTAFQASLLKNQLNVALISLGTGALPVVNAGLAETLKLFAQAGPFFTKGFDGTKIGGDFSKVQQAAYDAGEQVKQLFQWIEDNQGNIKSVFSFAGETFLIDAKNTVKWFIDNKEAMALAFGVIGAFFALSNPAWAGILAGGAILLGVRLLREDLSKLSDPLVQARIEVDKFLLRVLTAAEKTRRTLLSIGTLGISNLPGVKDLLNQSPEQKAIDKAQKDLADDIRDANSELSRRERLLNAEKEIQTRINVLQDEARSKAISFDDALQLEVETMIRLGGGTDGFARKLVEAAATIAGVDPSRIAYLRLELDAAEAAAKATTTNVGELGQATLNVEPPDVGDAGKAVIDDATAAAIKELGAVLAVVPPDVGDAGRAQLDAATAAGLNLSTTLDGVDPPDVGDAGRLPIELATRAAQIEANTLAGIKRPNVGDAGAGAIAGAAAAAWNLANALGAAARSAQSIGTLGSRFGAAARAEGGIVRGPEFALIGEAGPEAVLPLTDAARSRAIISALSPAFVAAIMPKGLDTGGVFAPVGSRYGTGLDLFKSVYPLGHWMNPGPDATRFDNWMNYLANANKIQNSYSGDSGGSGGGDFAPVASRQILATLSPSMIRSMAPPNNGGVTFDSMFGGDINIGATSSEVEALVVEQIHAIFARARSTTRLTGSLITGGVG